MREWSLRPLRDRPPYQVFRRNIWNQILCVRRKRSLRRESTRPKSLNTLTALRHPNSVSVQYLEEGWHGIRSHSLRLCNQRPTIHAL